MPDPCKDTMTFRGWLKFQQECLPVQCAMKMHERLYCIKCLVFFFSQPVHVGRAETIIPVLCNSAPSALSQPLHVLKTTLELLTNSEMLQQSLIPVQ